MNTDGSKFPYQVLSEVSDFVGELVEERINNLLESGDLTPEDFGDVTKKNSGNECRKWEVLINGAVSDQYVFMAELETKRTTKPLGASSQVAHHTSHRLAYAGLGTKE